MHPPVWNFHVSFKLLLSFSVQFSHSSCPTLYDPIDCSTPSFPILHHLPELASAHVHWVGDDIQLSCPLSSPYPPPSIFPSTRVFSNESALHIRWLKYWSCIISPANEYSGLVSFRIDWFDLLAVQGTLEFSPTPHFKSINSSMLSLLYGPTLTSIHDYWKNHSIECTDLFGKVMSLLFNALGLSKLIFQGASVF